MKTTSIRDQVVVLTGASSGIGAAVARGFAERGAKIVLLARRRERLQNLVAELGSESTMGICTDVTDYESVSSACQEILARWERVHVLINNAGVYPRECALWQLSSEEWQHTLDTNLTGVFHCVRAFVPSMIEHQYGRIINVSSPMISTPYAAVYSITKGAVDTISSVLAAELQDVEADVIVSSLDPGAVRTEMYPDGPSDPSSVVPIMLKLATLPPGSSNGEKWNCLAT